MTDVWNKENRAYKDTVFTDLFCADESAQENLYQLCKYLHPENNFQIKDIKPRRLSTTFSKKMQNDFVCDIEDKVLFFGEHQSTPNPNMPFRHLLYLQEDYIRMLEGRAIYSRKAIRIPTPEFYVFYNGKEKWNAAELKLSDLFKTPSQFPNNGIELVAKVYNIRYNEGNEILEKCRIMREYSQLVNECEKQRGKPHGLARAIEYCIEHNILRDYLSRKGREIVNMLTFEYDEELEKEVFKEECLEEGMEIGIEKGRIEGMVITYLDDGADESFIINKLMNKFSLSETEAKQYFDRFAMQEV